MKIGQLRLREVGSFGLVDRECRNNHHAWTAWHPQVHEGRAEFSRQCGQCSWFMFAEPAVDGPHRLERTIDAFGHKIGMCVCSRTWDGHDG